MKKFDRRSHKLKVHYKKGSPPNKPFGSRDKVYKVAKNIFPKPADLRNTQNGKCMVFWWGPVDPYRATKHGWYYSSPKKPKKGEKAKNWVPFSLNTKNGFLCCIPTQINHVGESGTQARFWAKTKFRNCFGT